ncbi:glycerophosphodiester phosphodiesterase family protein [Cecembia calidifontis]|jgi:glycerophosphoryl diester phosphodiesterase|uniref:glycerophosphodiester phosphodiesterase family protein n=1 Tax=Cecembia calidifontis TaxID=1187080 RepID=UPI0010294C4A|nr:glycerophosphodiester phosphodiesterase family protein [Cecembia calidifontis]
MIKKLCFLLLLGLFQLPVAAQSLRSLLAQEQTLIFIHRAALHPEIPENSLTGLKLAIEAGFHMLEIDVMESRDGVLYLLHDRTLGRTTDDEGNISDWDSRDLDQLRLKNTQETLPRFESFLDISRELGIYLMLDVKSAVLEKVINLVSEKNMLDRVVLLTFELERAIEAIGLDKKFLVSVLINSEDEFDEYLCKSADPYQLAVYLNKGAPLELFGRARQLGLPIITDVLGNIDEHAQEDQRVYREFLEKRKPGIIVTDYPQLLKEAIN